MKFEQWKISEIEEKKKEAYAVWHNPSMPARLREEAEGIFWDAVDELNRREALRERLGF